MLLPPLLVPGAGLPVLAAADTTAQAPTVADAPLDAREPPFGEFDFAWMNGSNPQPASLLTMGPVTWSLYIDTYFAWQFHQPIDHTIFPTTTAPRHDEMSLNLAHIGVDVTGLDGPTGRLYLQYGSIVETIAGQDTTTTRGFYLTNRLLQYVQQAAAGWHFHWLHGVNAELGIFPSYVGLESYLPEENWSYTHAFVSDATPYYFFGLRGQVFPSARLKIELWLVNGWQTFGEWHEARAGGYLWNWRPNAWLSIVDSVYVGQEAQADPDSLRVYSDNNVQVRYWSRPERRLLRSLAVSIVGDAGYEAPRQRPVGTDGRRVARAPLGVDAAVEEHLARRLHGRQDAGDLAEVPRGRGLPLARDQPVLRVGHHGDARLLAEPLAAHAPGVRPPHREPAAVHRLRRNHRSGRAAPHERRGRGVVHARLAQDRRPRRVQPDAAPLRSKRARARARTCARGAPTEPR
jgi:hypothetical protein